MPVISVVDAIAVRDAGADDREIAVRGWYAPYFPNRACGRASNEQAVWPLLVECPEDRLWLMQDPEPVITVTDSGVAWRGPTGSAISPAFGDIDRSWAFPIEDTTRLVELVVVGHFDDRRSAGCPANLGQACRDRFVVDRIESVDGEALPTSQVNLVEGSGMPFEDVEHIIDAVRPGVSILSAVHVDGDQGLRRMEPALAERGSSLIQEAMLWVVVVLDAGELGTYVIVDSTGSIYELTADGPVLVALSTPGERNSPLPSPIPRVRSTFTIEIGPVDTTVSVEVIDRTGFLDVARAATAAEIAGESRIPRPGTLVLRNLASDAILVTWTGSVCDAHPRLTIDSRVPDGPPRDLRLTEERPGCDAIGVGRAVVVQFSKDVDARDLVGTEEVHLVESPPEPTTMVVELDRGDSTESVLVTDDGGSLMEARAATAVPAIPDFIGVRIIRADDGGTIVLWEGALCDRDLWISIETDDLGPPDRIVVHGTRVEPCRLALVWRAIWLDLGPVDVASIRAGLSVGPSSGGPRDAGPVIGVPEALVIRSHAGDDHQLQVRGWYWRDPAVYDCFVPPSPPPVLESGCHGPHDRLVADPEDLTGPGFVVWLRPGVEAPPNQYGDPGEVVVVGHFDDTLAEACVVSTRDSCRNVFVVEEVLPASAP